MLVLASRPRGARGAGARRRVNRKGVSYDVGTRYGLGMSTRPRFSEAIVRRELEIIRHDLHCTAVKIGGYDPDRIAKAAVCALDQGLEVWFSPALFDKGASATLQYITEAARVAETVRQRSKVPVVFCVGQELMLFMDGIVPGHGLLGRLNHPGLREFVRAGKQVRPLNAFLSAASAATRGVFHGPVAYAALPWEGAEWGPFDLVGVDHYWDERVADRYLDMLKPFFATGKPVVVTGTGSRAYQGAHSSRTLGLGVTDFASQFWHRLPLVGRFVRPHLKKGTYVRDEGAQARQLIAVLSLLDRAGVEGVFIDSFVDCIAPYSEQAHYDLDMSSLSLVKTYAHGRGSTYPEMSWEPKEAFRAVAAYYADERAGPDRSSS
jgi:hypothetical protein